MRNILFLLGIPDRYLSLIALLFLFNDNLSNPGKKYETLDIVAEY